MHKIEPGKKYLLIENYRPVAEVTALRPLTEERRTIVFMGHSVAVGDWHDVWEIEPAVPKDGVPFPITKERFLFPLEGDPDQTTHETDKELTHAD